MAAINAERAELEAFRRLVERNAKERYDGFMHPTLRAKLAVDKRRLGELRSAAWLIENRARLDAWREELR